MKQYAQEVFEKPMNRREFLGYIGAAILAVIGVSGMLKALLHHNSNSSSNNQTVSAADTYGGTAYGGLQK